MSYISRRYTYRSEERKIAVEVATSRCAARTAMKLCLCRMSWKRRPLHDSHILNIL
jgi:hypothetical protein